MTSQPGVSRAGTLDFGDIEFQSPLVSIQRGVIALESWWCVELLFALFLLSWMSKGVRGKEELTSQSGLSKATTPGFGGIEFKMLLVPSHTETSDSAGKPIASGASFYFFYLEGVIQGFQGRRRDVTALCL